MSSDSIETREKILKAALTLLETKPEKLPRMSDIAKGAGISRQALYLHFDSRTDLLIATTRYQDDLYDVEARFAPSRNAPNGQARLDAFVRGWCGHMPKIWGVARALLTLGETEAEAAAAMEQRLSDVREGFEAAVQALDADGDLPGGLDKTAAIDLLGTLMHMRSWARLTQTCGWSQEHYTETMLSMARAILLNDAGGNPKG